MLTEESFHGSSLCVVGNINRDIKPGPVEAGAYLFKDGETSVSEVTESIGGGGANSAFAAAALHAEVKFVGKVGTDALGDRLERTLRRHAISAHLARDKAQPTGTSIALSFATGQRHFLSCLPASRALQFEDLDLAALSGVRHLLRADVWFSEPMLFGGNQALFREARRRGLTVSLDLNWDPAWGVASASEIQARKQAVRAALPWVNLAHGNVRELQEFTEAPDRTTALQRLTEWGVEAVVVHLGDQGAGYYHGGTLAIEPPAAVQRPVHSTGTGDVLSVCLMLLHHHSEHPINERLRLANGIVAQYMEGTRRLIPPLGD